MIKTGMIYKTLSGYTVGIIHELKNNSSGCIFVGIVNETFAYHYKQDGVCLEDEKQNIEVKKDA